MTFKEEVYKITNEIAEMLVEKNKSYGDSALNPVRIFSKSDNLEQLKVRIDDKLSRIANMDLNKDNKYVQEDTILDLMGYLILLKIKIQENNDDK